MIHIIIPVFNRWKFTEACLRSLRSQSFKSFKIIVVDHGSTDGTSENIRNEFQEVVVLQGDESMWWTAATNMGVKYALENYAQHILTLNNDLIVDVDYLQKLYDVMLSYPKSIVGSVAVDKNKPSHVVYAGTKFNKWTAKYRPAVNLSDFEIVKEKREFIYTDLLCGRGTLIPADAFKQVGLFDELHFPHYAADEDFSLRCKKKGFVLIIATNAIVKSEVDATGLKNIHTSHSREYWKDLFTSQRSPVNLKRRWFWAKQNSPVPILYFGLDLIRILKSQIISK